MCACVYVRGHTCVFVHVVFRACMIVCMRVFVCVCAHVCFCVPVCVFECMFVCLISMTDPSVTSGLLSVLHRAV